MAEEGRERLLKEGDKFGDYTVVRLLGKGGMGAVYLMRGTSGSEYAVKIMFPDKVSHDMRRRFAKEAEFAIKIRHRNLVSVYDVGEDPETGLCYMIMDYVPGGSLADRLKAKGRFSIQEAVSIALQIAAALDVAHKHGLVHRDIKPDNIMFDADGTPKLSDLGVAKFDDAQQSMVTTTGMVIGTPAYMAPEQMLNSHEIDARADIYSLGVVLYEMLSGKRPNEGRTAIELMAKAIKGEPLPDIKAICPELSVAVAHVVSLLCAPKPEERPQTALDAADLLRKAASGKLMLVRKKPQSSAAEAAAWRARCSKLVKGVAVGIGIAAFLFVGIAGWVKALGRREPAKVVVATPVTNVVSNTNIVTPPQKVATLVHRWSFNGKTEEEKLTDSVGGLVATKIGDAITFEDGQAVLSGAGHGTGSLNLGKGILGDDSATIEIWATRTAFKRFARVFDYGIDSGTYFTLSWNMFSSRNFHVEVFKNTVPLRSEKRQASWRDNDEIYVAMTVKAWTDGTSTIKWNVFDSMNAVKKDRGVLNLQSDEIKILDFTGANFYLGHSQYPADADANAKYDEVRIWKGVLSDAVISRNVKLGPDASKAELEASAVTTTELPVIGREISTNALYCVVDLSGGPNAASYPVSYLDAVPEGGWSDEYKTTKLVLRRIEPGTFIMGENQSDEAHRVTLTKPFYIGVFEVTQKQYELVTGNNPSEFQGAMRPVGNLSFNDIRGEAKIHNWPNVHTVDANSFVGRVRTRTGLNIDLPPETEWEYACRAGTTSKFNNGGNGEDDWVKVGRVPPNQSELGWLEPKKFQYVHKPDGKGGYDSYCTVVGMYLPNAWGLYDMHGNLWEWTLEWAPLGSRDGAEKVIRGGCWDSPLFHCTSFSCRKHAPGYKRYVGFRLFISVSDGSEGHGSQQKRRADSVSALP